MHPIQSAVEQIYAQESCPRLHINVTCEGVECPDHIKAQWGERLVIDLDPSYPLELEFSETGVAANLSFGGFVERCVFPWASIYVVGERDTGRGRVIADHVPESLRAEMAPPDPKFAGDLNKLAKSNKRSSETRRRRRRKSAEPDTPAIQPMPPGIRAVPQPTEASEQVVPEMARESSSTATEPSTSESATDTREAEVQRRRGVFRVIDGGA